MSYVGSEVLLDVRDDGRGFADETGGFGLTSMRQRIRGVGGHIAVQSAAGEETSISARGIGTCSFGNPAAYGPSLPPSAGSLTDREKEVLQLVAASCNAPQGVAKSLRVTFWQ